MYTLVMHCKSFWPVQPTTNVQACLSSKINWLFIPGNIFGQQMAMEYSHVEFVRKFPFRVNFSEWLRGVSIYSAVGRQSLIPELVRDVKMLKTFFYNPLPMSLTETLSTQWYWCCTTPSHTSTPSQLARNAKMCCQICQTWIFLANLHKFCDVLIFALFPRSRMSQNKIFAIPKVKDIAEFNFHKPKKGEGCLGILLCRSRTKTSLKTPWPNFVDPLQPISGPH